MGLWDSIKDKASSVAGNITNPLGSYQNASKTKTSQMSTMSDEQEAAYNSLLAALQGIVTGYQSGSYQGSDVLQNYISSLKDSALNEYNDVTIPGLLEKMGTLHSSSTNNSLLQAGEDYQTGLNEMISNLYYQDYQSALSQLAALLGYTTVENIVEKPSWYEALMGGASTDMGTGLGVAFPGL